MSIEKLQDAIGQTDDDLIIEAKRTARARQLIRRTTLIAAAAALIITSALILSQESTPEPPDEDQIQIQNTLPSDPPGTSGPSAPLLTAPTTQPTPPDSTTPSTPSVISGTVTISDRVISSYPLQGCIGSLSDTMAPTVQGELAPAGVTVTAKAIETLPGTFSYLDSKWNRTYRIIRMETVTTHLGSNMADEFYFLLPSYIDAELTEFDCLLLTYLTQYSYENQILLDQETNELQAFDLLLFTSYHMWGFQDQVCVKNIYDPDDYPGDLGKSLDQMQQEILVSYSPSSHTTVRSLNDITSNEITDVLTYLTPFKNGTYIQTYDPLTMYSDNHYIGYCRYLNGYPTNETIFISGERVSHSDEKFTQEEIQDLPDLPSALSAINQAFDAGQIAPPHILDYENTTLKDQTIHGWYAKCDSGVYGVIRVGWNYSAIDRYSQDRLDDKYYIIGQHSSEVVPIQRDDLIDMLGESGADYVFKGDYDSSGMVYDFVQY